MKFIHNHSFFIHNGWNSFITIHFSFIKWHSSTCIKFIHFCPFSSIMYEIHSQNMKFMHYCPSSFIIKLFVKSNKHGTRSHVCLVHRSYSPTHQFFKKLLKEAQSTILHQALEWIKFHVKLFCHHKAQLEVLPPSSSFHASYWNFLLSFFFLQVFFYNGGEHSV